MTGAKHTPTPWAADGTDICQKNNGHFHVIAQARLFRDYDAIDIANKQSAPDRHQHLIEISCPVEGTEEGNAEFICRAVNCYDELVSACKAQHEAIDRLMARLIELDPKFMPTKCGQPWEAALKGNAAIEKAAT